MSYGQYDILNEEEQIAFWNGASPILASKLKGKQVMVLCSGRDEPVGQRVKLELEKLGVKVVYGSTNHPLNAGGGAVNYNKPFDESAFAVMVVPEYKERAEDRVPDNGITETMKELSSTPLSYRENKDVLPGISRESEILGSSKIVAINPRKGAPVIRFLSQSSGGIHEFGRLNSGTNFASRAVALIR